MRVKNSESINNPMPKVKVCSKCFLEKPLSCFQKDSNPKKAGKFGCKSYCKECAKVLRKSYYLRNKEKEYSNHKIWLNSNRERFNGLQNKYYKQDPNKFNTRSKKRYHKIKGFCTILAHYKKTNELKYYTYIWLLLKNVILRRRESNKVYFLKYTEKVKARNKEYYYKNWDTYRTYTELYKHAFPEKVKEQRKRRSDELRDGYIADYISKLNGIPPYISKQLPMLIELKRKHIQVKRSLKTK